MLKKISKLFIISIISLSFISCENFLSGSKLINNMEEQIYIANHEQPVARIISPVTSPNGDYKNTSIIITFTKAINIETFNDNCFITNSTGESVKANYSSPVWNETYTQVIFTANENNPIPVNNNGFENITINLKTNIRDIENVPLSSEINETYKLNSYFDKEKPEFVSINAAINSSAFTETTPQYFIEGIIDDTNTEKTINILETNHINNNFFIKMEGHDYADYLVFANIKYKRVFSTDGNEVSDPEDSIIEPLVIPEGSTTNNAEKTISIDLSDTKYNDGLYKISIFLTDKANNQSEETKTYYVIKDTKYSMLSKFTISSNINDYRNWKETKAQIIAQIENPPAGMTEDDINYLKYRRDTEFPPTYTKLKEMMTRISLTNVENDEYFIYKGRIYTTSGENLKITAKYGTGPTNLNEKEFTISTEDIENNFLIVNSWIDGSTNSRTVQVLLPEEIFNTLQNCTTDNLYIEFKVTDTVGNYTTKGIYYPKTTPILGYTSTPTQDGKYKYTLQFEDHSYLNESNIFKLEDYEITTYSRIYYGKKEAETSNELTTIYRNFDPTLQPYQQFEWDNNTDKPDFISFDSDPSTEYIAYVYTLYKYNRNGNWVGDIAGPCTLIEHISSNNAVSTEEIAVGLNTLDPSTLSSYVTHNAQAKNTGLMKISINKAFTSLLTNTTDVKYYYGWKSSGNSTAWNYYTPETSSSETDTFTVPLNFEPDNTNPSWISITYDFNNNVNPNLNVSFPPTAYSVDNQLKIIAIKGTSQVVESQPITITINSNEDNISPEINTWPKAHDLTICADGSGFYTDNNVFIDKQWNEANYFTYYYKPYHQTWGNRLDVFSAEEIRNISDKASTKLLFSTWNDGYSDVTGWHPTTINHNPITLIPVNGLADGDYMFFITVSDIYGNSSTGTLGKTHIGTFKNKMSVSYNDNEIKVELPLAANESNFKENHLLIQVINPTDNLWVPFTNNSERQYMDNRSRDYSHVINLKALNNKFTFSTKDTTNKTPNNSVTNLFPATLPRGEFYKFNITSYNVDESVGLNINNDGYHSFDQPEGLSSEESTEWDKNHPYENYDSFIDETASVPAYLYVPTATDPSTFTTYFEKQNSIIYSDGPVLVEVLSSLINLEDNIDEWQRRGKLQYSGVLSGDDHNLIDFNYNNANEIMFNAKEQGKRYFVIIAHFADNTARMSKVFECN